MLPFVVLFLSLAVANILSLLCKQETVILSINCTSAAKIAYKKISMQLETSSGKFSGSYL